MMVINCRQGKTCKYFLTSSLYVPIFPICYFPNTPLLIVIFNKLLPNYTPHTHGHSTFWLNEMVRLLKLEWSTDHSISALLKVMNKNQRVHNYTSSEYFLFHIRVISHNHHCCSSFFLIFCNDRNNKHFSIYVELFIWFTKI